MGMRRAVTGERAEQGGGRRRAGWFRDRVTAPSPSPRTRRSLAGTAALLALGALSACSPGPLPTDLPTPTHDAGDGTVGWQVQAPDGLTGVVPDPALRSLEMGGTVTLVADSLVGYYKDKAAPASGGDVATTVAVRDLATGQVRWSREIDGVLCTPRGPAPDASALVCRGRVDGRNQIQVLGLADGATELSWDLGGELGLLHATTGAVVGIDVPDPTTGATIVRWWDERGRERWSQGVTPGDGSPLADGLVSFSGDPLSLQVQLETVAGGVLMTSWRGDGVLLTPEGPQALDCRYLATAGDAYLCSDDDGTRLVRGGATVWAGPVEDATPLRFYTPVTEPALVRREQADGPIGVLAHRWIDPATGDSGEVLVESAGEVVLAGSAAVPVLAAAPDSGSGSGSEVTVVSFDPETGDVGWSVIVPVVGTSQLSVVTTTDRVLVLTDSSDAVWTVLDAADGSVTGTVFSGLTPLPVGREVVTGPRFDTLALVAVP